VEDAEHADLGPEMTGIGSDLTQRRRARLKEPRVQTGPVPIGQGQECMREREDDVHIRHVEGAPVRGPPRQRLRCVLGMFSSLEVKVLWPT
jgi:hypothetical protein